MSKKSKKILAYLMFVAALCGTPAVSEARGGSGGQVETEKASASQRGNFSQSFISYIFRNYGPEVAKAIFYGGGSFGFAKVLKAGDLSTWSSYLLNLKDAKSKDAEKLMKQVKEKEKKLKEEENLFEASRAKAIEDNTKLNDEKVALELNNNALNAKVKESEKKIEELKNSKEKLDSEVLDLRDHNNKLINLTNKDNEKIDALLSEFLPYKMSGELKDLKDGAWKQESYKVDESEVFVVPYSGKDGVKVVTMKYDSNGNALNQQPEWSTLPADGIIDAIKNKVVGDLVNVSFKDIGLSDCDVFRLARGTFVSYGEQGEIKEAVAAYFPVKNFYVKVINNVKNVENNVNNENVNENNENVNENNEINGENSN